MAVSNSTPWRQRAREDLEQMKLKLVGEGGEYAELEAEIEGEMEGAEMHAYFPDTRLHQIVLWIYLASQITLAIIATAQWIFVDPVYNINVGQLILLAQIAHIAASLRSIDVDDLAGITFFGRPTKEPGPGLILVPWLLMRLHKASRNYKDIRLPGPANKILRLSAEEQSQREFGDIPNVAQAEAGLVRPIIAVSGVPKLSASDKRARKGLEVDPFDERNTFEIAYPIRYRPNQRWGGIFRLIRNIGMPRNGRTLDDMMVDHLRENSERDIKALIARHTLATIIENQELFNEVFAYRLQASVMRLGIQIDPQGTGLDDLNPSHKTNEAQADARRARFSRTQTIIAADAEKEKKIREGEGAATAERLILEARAEGFKKIAEAANVDGNVVIASETARNFKDANTIFGAQGIKEVLAMPQLLGRTDEKKDDK